MKVLKFGGSSQCLTGYNKIIQIINNALKSNEQIVIVLSAISGVTSLLEKFLETKDRKYIIEVLRKNNLFVQELNKEFKKEIDICDLYDALSDSASQYIEMKIPDIQSEHVQRIEPKVIQSEHVQRIEPLVIHLKSKIIGWGEVLSTHIFYQLTKDISSKISLGDSYKIICSRMEITTLNPCVEFYCSDVIFKLMDKDNTNILITQGFIASTPSGKPIILGRGGSDTTGALIANTLNASEYQVWSDVDGIYSADPRLISEANLMTEVNYNIVQEMAGMGAKVMHPYSILPCQEKNIPIKLFNTFSNTDKYGTMISTTDKTVYCVTAQKNITLFKITSLSMWDSYGFVYDIFKMFSDKKVNVNIISTSQFSISTTTDEKELSILKELSDELEKKYQVEMNHGYSVVSLVSDNLMHYLDKVIVKDSFELIHYSSNNLTISYVVKSDKVDDMIKFIHKSIC